MRQDSIQPDLACIVISQKSLAKIMKSSAASSILLTILLRKAVYILPLPAPTSKPEKSIPNHGKTWAICCHNTRHKKSRTSIRLFVCSHVYFSFSESFGSRCRVPTYVIKPSRPTIHEPVIANMMKFVHSFILLYLLKPAIPITE